MRDFRRHLEHIFWLGAKELVSLRRDRMMLFLIVWAFTGAVYVAGTALPETLHRAPIALVDEDGSMLSARIAAAFYPPQFLPPQHLSLDQIDPALDAGRFTFVLIIPPHFERDLIRGETPALQLNIDATRMSQAFIGNGAIVEIVQGEVREFLAGHRSDVTLSVEWVPRMRFNPALNPVWFSSLMEVINAVTMLSIILTGAALIREREHGTIEHLLVMPVTPTEIMLAKVWSMALVVWAATSVSLALVVRGLLQVPIEGSVPLFLAGAMLHLFATTSLGIFMATIARSMPQFGLMMMLTLMPLELLSGGITPRESMPRWVQILMSFAPTTHFTEIGQAILYRAAGFEVVWPHFAALLAMGLVLFALARARFRKTLSLMG